MTPDSENETEGLPLNPPRVAGVQEHYQRVKFFHALASKCSDSADRFRLRMAGVYSARAVVELILEAAEKGELTRTRSDLKAHLSEQIPWHELIERIRIHDFHRFGLVPPDPRFREMILGGPVKLRVQKGAATYRLPASGPEKLTTGNARIQEQRPLLSDDGEFFDDVTRQYLSLDRVLHDFIAGAVGAIREFERNCGPTDPPT